MPENLPKINILSEIGEHWIENSLEFFFFFYFKWLVSVVYMAMIQNVS